MIQLTSVGEQAYEIAQWAFEDPPGRKAQAQQRLAGLHVTTQKERNEVGDASLMVARLAGPAQLAGRNISDQMREDTGGQ
jgi:hypothetical protein